MQNGFLEANIKCCGNKYVCPTQKYESNSAINMADLHFFNFNLIHPDVLQY
jgi:hypothetical protein